MAGRRDLGRDLARMTALQRELRATLDRVEHTLNRLSVTAGADGARTVLPGKRPLRVQLLDIVQDIGWMAYAREIATYAYARYDLVIAPGRFGSLAKDEVDAYKRRGSPRSRNRTVWVCFGLRHDDAAPVRRLVARSDWSLERRIWAPTTGRVQHLRALARLCELALDTENTPLANPEALYPLILSYAQDLPVKTVPGEYQFEEWRERALALLSHDDLEARDYDLRQQAAERWSGLSEMHQLFGWEPADIQAADDASGGTA